MFWSRTRKHAHQHEKPKRRNRHTRSAHEGWLIWTRERERVRDKRYQYLCDDEDMKNTWFDDHIGPWTGLNKDWFGNLEDDKNWYWLTRRHVMLVTPIDTRIHRRTIRNIPWPASQPYMDTAPHRMHAAGQPPNNNWLIIHLILRMHTPSLQLLSNFTTKSKKRFYIYIIYTFDTNLKCT